MTETVCQYDARQDRDARKDAATLRIKEKIAILELWHADGVPEGYEWRDRDKPEKKYSYPTNLSEFLRWSDDELKADVKLDGKKHVVNGVYKVGAPSLDKAERSALKKRAKELVDAIKHRPSDKKDLTRVKAENEALVVLTQGLTNEITVMQTRIMEFEENFKRVTAENNNLRQRIVDLEQKLTKVLPLRLRSVQPEEGR